MEFRSKILKNILNKQIKNFTVSSYTGTKKELDF